MKRAVPKSELKAERAKCYSAAELKERGWTDTAITKFAGEADKTLRNPVFKKAAPMRLWLKARISRIEKTRRFLAWQIGAEDRKGSAVDGVQTRQSHMEEQVSEAEITIDPGWSEERLKALSLSTHGGNYEGEPRGEWHWNNRTARNTIRHCLTNYEDLWKLINRGKTSEPAYRLLSEKVEALIDATYPKYRGT